MIQADLMHRHNIGMLEPGSDSGFLEKTIQVMRLHQRGNQLGAGNHTTGKEVLD